VTVSQPWWAIPLFTLIGTITGVLLSQSGNLLNEHLRRKADRAARWDKDKATAYLDYQRAALELMHLRVWPTEPAVAPALIEPPLTTLFRRNEELTNLSHQRVSVAANEVAAKAHHLARTIEEIRETTQRGPAGAMPDDAGRRYAAGRRDLAESLQQFAVTWRQDLGITAPYTAGLDADGSVLDPVR
jgi:hypothetical protein